jgi:hypothetical protein
MGDASVYYSAALNMHRGEPIVQRPGGPYLYPPILAATLSPAVVLGVDAFMKMFHLLNFPAVVLLAVLLYLALLEFRFSRELAAVVILVLMVANVPISRTLIYNQVNIYVMDLVLISLIAFGRADWLSALALALATQLKVFPMVLLLPFLYVRAWRWCSWFLLLNALIIGVVSIGFGFSYFVAFAAQLGGISRTTLRNAAVDAFLYNTVRLWGVIAPAWLSASIRAILGVLVMIAGVRLGRRPAFSDGSPERRMVLTAYVVLPVFMLVVSPLVWEHHFVMWVLTMPVLASSLRHPHEWWMFVPAYIFLFLTPAYDIYPLSYLRLLGMLLIVALLHILSARHEDGEPDLFRQLNAWAQLMPGTARRG